jgi:GNAT superfamily N-acetyltransferase
MAETHHVTVRPMRSEDAPDVVSMASELAAAVDDPAPALSESDLIRNGFGPERWFDCLVAELGGQPVGYAVFCKGFEAHTARKRLWLGDLYVRPGARRSGVGHALMAAVARRALELGCEAVYWELWRANVTGAAFYRKFGAEQAADLAVMRINKHHLEAIAAGVGVP